MIGMRPRACCTAMRISSLCSSKFTVGDSPVVPTTTMPSVPSDTCQSMRLLKCARSRLPSSCIGVTIATRLPVIMGTPISRRDFNRFTVIAPCTKTLNHRGFRPFHRALLESHRRKTREGLEQLPRPQEEGRIRRPAEALVAHHESFVDERPALLQRLFKSGKK